ncbi:DUF1858 domain-containing protein [Limisalsivibrio acetivorans]|uniref:DUF1858 domain-containing protein n=1 Tax=Limisalsivibrio acetivorans TaxID=1304888 RepID=UPI0003B2F8CE|nr:DUF1858 domain-containing protein [Limisalsivibrio acetivorans]
MEITKKTIIADVLRHNPKTSEVFEKYNMGCVSCMGVANESIEKGCLMHGLDVEEVLADLKNFLNSSNS